MVYIAVFLENMHFFFFNN